MATENTERIASLMERTTLLAAHITKQLGKADLIASKIAQGKAKADGPKAKEERQLRESVRLYQYEIYCIQNELAALTQEPAEMTPAAIDLVLFGIWAERWTTTQHLHSARQTVANTVWPEATPTDRYGRKQGFSVLPFQLDRYGEEIAECEAKLEELAAREAPYLAEFNARGGWVRYTLVQGGHLHYHGCHTLRWDTARLLVPQASGLNADEVVGHFGTTACTKCFPGAPV